MSFPDFSQAFHSPLRFDMVAMIFLLYDLCITPVAIAWDFPMSGWLLCPGAIFLLKVPMEKIGKHGWGLLELKTTEFS